MEKATGCSSLCVNIQQKKRVRFFLDTVGWEGRTLKAAEPALLCWEGTAWASRVLPLSVCSRLFPADSLLGLSLASLRDQRLLPLLWVPGWPLMPGEEPMEGARLNKGVQKACGWKLHVLMQPGTLCLGKAAGCVCPVLLLGPGHPLPSWEGLGRRMPSSGLLLLGHRPAFCLG